MSVLTNKKRECCGCGACVSICPAQCITMAEDEEGFSYPNANGRNCVECGLCTRVCPAIAIHPDCPDQISCYAAQNQEVNARLKSSSGGVFSALAEEVLRDCGVVYGASFKDGSRSVQHRAVDSLDKLDCILGSKYIQSASGGVFPEIRSLLVEGRKVLFVGTPCQVQGLKNYLRSDYENLICIDFVCHGVPSGKLWRKYLRHYEAQAQSPINTIHFRDKSHGWDNYSVRIAFQNGKVKRISHYADMFMRLYLSDVCLRPSCYNCQFKGNNRASDLTLSDFWGIGKVCPEMNDNTGTSAVYCRTKVGRDLFTSSQKLAMKEVDAAAAIRMNPNILVSPAEPQQRTAFFEELEDSPLDRLTQKYSKKIPIRSIVKGILQDMGLLSLVRRLHGAGK